MDGPETEKKEEYDSSTADEDQKHKEKLEALRTSYDKGPGPLHPILKTRFGIAAGSTRQEAVPEWPVIDMDKDPRFAAKAPKSNYEFLKLKANDNIHFEKPMSWWREVISQAAYELEHNEGVKRGDISTRLQADFGLEKRKVLMYLPEEYKDPAKVELGRHGGLTTKAHRAQVHGSPSPLQTPSPSSTNPTPFPVATLSVAMPPFQSYTAPPPTYVSPPPLPSEPHVTLTIGTLSSEPTFQFVIRQSIGPLGSIQPITIPISIDRVPFDVLVSATAQLVSEAEKRGSKEANFITAVIVHKHPRSHEALGRFISAIATLPSSFPPGTSFPSSHPYSAGDDKVHSGSVGGGDGVGRSGAIGLYPGSIVAV